MNRLSTESASDEVAGAIHAYAVEIVQDSVHHHGRFDGGNAMWQGSTRQGALTMSWDEAYAQRYDEWSAHMTADIAFYVASARQAEGPLVPRLPERTHLFRALTAQRAWTDHFLAEPSLLGVADTYGIELIHPRREGRSVRPLGDKGLSNWRWIIGAKLGFVLNHLGLFVAWDCNRVSVADQEFRHLVAQFAEQMVILADTGFQPDATGTVHLSIAEFSL